jgi:hypothetical protein
MIPIKKKMIAKGSSRCIYVDDKYPDWVIKKKHLKSKHFIDENYLEYLVYKNFCKFGKSNWLSPCYYFNHNLYMKKVSKIDETKKFNVPTLFSRSGKNWGILQNQIVCIDYDWLFYKNLNIKQDIKSVKRLKQSSYGIYVFEDMYKYLNKILGKHTNIEIRDLNPIIIKNKFMLENILKQRTSIQHE